MGMLRISKKVDASGDGRTKQCFKGTCDINKLVAQYKKQGQFGHVNDRVPSYGDVAAIGDFHAAMNTVAQATQMFEALPWQVRERFANDAGKMVAFLQDPGNRAEAQKLGMLKADVKPEGSGKAENGPSGPVASGGASGANKAADGAPKAS